MREREGRRPGFTARWGTGRWLLPFSQRMLARKQALPVAPTAMVPTVTFSAVLLSVAASVSVALVRLVPLSWMPRPVP